MNINRQNVDTLLVNYTKKKGNLGNRTRPESTFLEGKNFNCAIAMDWIYLLSAHYLYVLMLLISKCTEEGIVFHQKINSTYLFAFPVNIPKFSWRCVFPFLSATLWKSRTLDYVKKRYKPYKKISCNLISLLWTSGDLKS